MAKLELQTTGVGKQPGWRHRDGRQATEERVPENQRVGKPLCSHLTLNLERSDVGIFTGDFCCLDCGESITNKHRHLVLD